MPRDQVAAKTVSGSIRLKALTASRPLPSRFTVTELWWATTKYGSSESHEAVRRWYSRAASVAWASATVPRRVRQRPERPSQGRQCRVRLLRGLSVAGRDRCRPLRLLAAQGLDGWMLENVTRPSCLPRRGVPSSSCLQQTKAQPVVEPSPRRTPGQAGALAHVRSPIPAVAVYGLCAPSLPRLRQGSLEERMHALERRVRKVGNQSQALGEPRRTPLPLLAPHQQQPYEPAEVVRLPDEQAFALGQLATRRAAAARRDDPPPTLTALRRRLVYPTGRQAPS